MATFNPRLSQPSSGDLNWIHYTAGGYNYCIKVSGNSCIPNCTGYAWGRWRELLGAYHNLSRANARLWYGNTSDGYKRGQTPKLGAVACWDSTTGDAGHVAIVEQINSDGSIVTSNSGYNSTRFWTQVTKKPYNIGSSYSFQGFIYPPVDFGGGGTVSTTVTYQSHDSRYGWNPNVTSGTNEYAGNFGYNVDGIYLDKHILRVHDMVKNQWLPWVVDRNDYAGNLGNAIDGVQIDGAAYRVHLNGGSWLDWVYKCDGTAEGYAGIYGRAIDAIQIKPL